MEPTTARPGQTAIGRLPPNTNACPRPPLTNFFGPITYASPTTTRLGSIAKCRPLLRKGRAALPSATDESKLPGKDRHHRDHNRRAVLLAAPASQDPHPQEETLPRKDALAKFGITDRPDLTVQVVEQQGGPSLVDVHGSEQPIRAITPNQATELSILLRDAGEETLGQEIAAAAAEAQKANQTT
jgi:hypothetical protein